MATSKPIVLVYNPLKELYARADASRNAELARVLYAKRRLVDLLRREMFEPLRTSYKFNLTPQGSEKYPVYVKFYTYNSQFYFANDDQPDQEMHLTQTQVDAYIKQFSKEISQELRARLGNVPALWQNIYLFGFMRSNIHSIIRVEPPIAFLNKDTKTADIACVRCIQMDFVVGTGSQYIDTTSGTIPGNVLLSLIYDEAATLNEQIVALGRGNIYQFVSDNEATRVGRITLKRMDLMRIMVLVPEKKYCKMMCSRVADVCLESGVEMVDVHSINTASHMCYIRSFLQPDRFTHALLVISDAPVAIPKAYALVDPGTVDDWLLGNNIKKPNTISNINIGDNLYSKFFRTSSSLDTYCQSLEFLSSMEHSISIMEVLCPENDAVTRAVQHFVMHDDPIYDPTSWRSKRRVLYIRSANDYKKHIKAERYKLEKKRDAADEGRMPPPETSYSPLLEPASVDDIYADVVDMGDESHPLELTVNQPLKKQKTEEDFGFLVEEEEEQAD